MRLILSAALFVVALALSGCNEVTFTDPIGTAAVADEVQSLAGRWVDAEGEVFDVRLKNSGELIAGYLEWNEADQKFQVEDMPIVATTCGELLLLNMHAGQDRFAPSYFLSLSRYEFRDANTIQLYLPSHAIFQSAVESGRLSGKIKRSPPPDNSVKVHVDSTAEEVKKFLQESGGVACFETKPWGTFKRLKPVK